MSLLTRHNVRIRGIGDRAMVFAHGFGCDQTTWRHIAPQFELEFVTVAFDHVGAGGSDLSAYQPQSYRDLWAYADDVVELGKDLHWEDAIFVGHSCSAMIGALASIKAPAMFERLILVAPSPRYIDDGAYVGGFSHAQITQLLAELEGDFAAWSAKMAPIFMGNADRPELAGELLRSFARTDPLIASSFARAIFTSDNRAELAQVSASTLILQCAEDPVAPPAVGEYLRSRLARSELEVLPVEGHFPQLSAPDLVIAAMRRFVSVVSDVDFANSVQRPAKGTPPARPFFQPTRPDLHRLSAAEDRAALEDLLLRREGELMSHLGRYDMHALAIAELFGKRGGAAPGEIRYNVRTRGDAISELMHEFAVARPMTEEFAAIQTELLVVLDRNEISAQHSSDLTRPFDIAIRGARKACVNPRDWYDFKNASDDDLYAAIDLIEQDIVKVTSLYLRLSDLLTPLRRTLTRH